MFMWLAGNVTLSWCRGIKALYPENFTFINGTKKRKGYGVRVLSKVARATSPRPHLGTLRPLVMFDLLSFSFPQEY